jgi:hypothetical protein
MPDCIITIEVDPQTAQAYGSAREEERKKIQALLRLRARELAVEKRPSLSEVMDEVGRKAQARGLTPELLESLLREP